MYKQNKLKETTITETEAVRLLNDALSFQKTYWGCTTTPPRPNIILNQLFKSEELGTAYTTLFLRDTNSIFLKTTGEPIKTMTIQIGEEATHYWHHHETPTLGNIHDTLAELETSTDSTDEQCKNKTIELLCDGINSRGVLECIGCIGGLEYARSKGIDAIPSYVRCILHAKQQASLPQQELQGMLQRAMNVMYENMYGLGITLYTTPEILTPSVRRELIAADSHKTFMSIIERLGREQEKRS